MDTFFTGHLALKFTKDWFNLSKEERRDVNAQTVQLFEKYQDRVTLRGAYHTQGFRADTDLFLWMYGHDFNDIQDLELELRRSELGRYVETPWAFAGITLESEFNKSHSPAFMRGVPAKEYICFYPFIRTPEWYLMDAAEREEMLKAHGNIGRKYPQVRTNNVHSFGLGDFEWLLSFETDNLTVLVQMVRHQRDAAARAYTKYEWPFIVGRRFDLPEALNRLV